jgi:hypothetical protein
MNVCASCTNQAKVDATQNAQGHLLPHHNHLANPQSVHSVYPIGTPDL